jgi:hypothetical protein
MKGNTTCGIVSSSRTGRVAAAALLVAATFGLGGCANAMEGSVNGAGIGALAGMGLGSLNGRMGEGAAAGAILGGLFGGWQGYQNSMWSGGGYGGGCRRFRD